MRIRKALITAAGKGTRMYPITAIIPKALLPLYVLNSEGQKALMPISEIITNRLKEAGIEEICFVVGKQGRILKSYFKNEKFSYLKQKGHKGFGDAALVGESFANNEPILIHTDDILLSSGYEIALKLFDERDADGVFFIRQVENPKRYGIVSVTGKEEFMGHDVYTVTDAEEKPENPKSNNAIVGLYLFSPKIFEELKKSYKKNHELTYGIQGLIKSGGKVYAIMMKEEKRFNVGDPDNYFTAIKQTYEMVSQK